MNSQQSFVIDILEKAPFRVRGQQQLQRGCQVAIEKAGFLVKPNVVIDGGTIDYYLPALRMALVVRAADGLRGVDQRLHRIAWDPRVDSILIITDDMRYCGHLRDTTFENKPVFVHQLTKLR